MSGAKIVRPGIPVRIKRKTLPPTHPPMPDPIKELLLVRKRVSGKTELDADTKREISAIIYQAALHLLSDDDAWLGFCKRPEWLGKSRKPRMTAQSREKALFLAKMFAVNFDTNRARDLGRLVNRHWNTTPKVHPADIEKCILDYQNAGKQKADEKSKIEKEQKLVLVFEPDEYLAHLVEMSGKVRLVIDLDTYNGSHKRQAKILRIAGGDPVDSSGSRMPVQPRPM